MKVESICIQCNKSFIKYPYERYKRCENCRDINFREKYEGVTKEEKILKMAEIIQKIDHSEYHTWESCDQGARDRALKQARAVYNYLFS